MTSKTHIAQLRETTTLYQLAGLLGYSPKGFAYVVYGIKDENKYKNFEIPKRSGGVRTISAPIPELKTLQRRLADFLEKCWVEINSDRGIVDNISHGFRPKKSIMTNAQQHRKRVYVFNTDLKDFFGTIKFGRIVGFFRQNRYFQLNQNVARMLAQIACHDKTLPQGSPCSPVIANLVSHILDIRLANLASRHGCYYTRYADDLTFSTNEKTFPKVIASRVDNSNEWRAGKSLLKIIKQTDFAINPAKTRMQYKRFRQEVTGIVVNSKINLNSDYIKETRAQVNTLVTTGNFTNSKKYKNEEGRWLEDITDGRESQLSGALSYIDSVRHFEKQKNVVIQPHADYRPSRVLLKDMDGASKTFRKFLTFTKFFRPTKPLVMCEGKTDKVYIHCALQSLHADHPQLAGKKAGRLESKISFFNYTKIADRILHIGGGTGDLDAFIANYDKETGKFKRIEKRNPIIVLVDNDSGSSSTFSTIKRITKSKTDVDGSASFYFIRDNLYVIAIPKIKSKPTTIEDYFDDSVRKTKHGGRSFSGSDKFDAKTEYGKHVFAEHVVKKNRDTIDFSRFRAILTRIELVIEDYNAKP